MSSLRPIIVVTGANSGIGFGICHRLLIQLSQLSPPDTRPQFRPVQEDAHLEEIKVPPCDALTLILACRSEQRAMDARRRLLALLDDQVDNERSKPGYNGHAEVFRDNLRIDFHPIDMSVVSSVFQFGDRLSENYPYISHLICNAGCGAFNGINWLIAMKQFFAQPLVSFTVTEYKRQVSGRLSDDGLGYVWQCNVFSHYVLYRYTQPLLDAYKKASAQPARVLWTSSLESTPRAYSHDDWQLIKSDQSYEGTKYEIDMISHHLALRALKEEGDSPTIRHFTVHPGIAESNMVKDLVWAFLDIFKLLIFYIVRFCGSPNHPITAYNAAVSATYVSLAPLGFIPTALSTWEHIKVTSLPSSTVLEDSLITNNLYANGIDSVTKAQSAELRGVPPPLKFGAQADKSGRQRVGVMTVLEWEEHEKEAEYLVEKCESLYQTFLKLKAMEKPGALSSNGKA